MEQIISQIVTIAKGMWRYRWPGLAVAWLVAIVGVVIVFRVPDKYEASARIYVDTQSILKPLMSGLAIQPNVEQQVSMLTRTLISRPNMEKLVRMADLDLGKQTKAEQDELVTSLMGTVRIQSTGRDNLYTLAYRDSVPAKAQKVVQSLVSMFVESSLGSSRKDTQAAKAFLDEQIKAYEAKLEEAETRLKDFRVRNIEMNNAEGKDSAARIGELGQQLKEARLALKEAEQGREAGKQQLQAMAAQMAAGGSAAADSAFAAGPNTVEIDERIAALNKNLDALLQRYTEQHPDVVATKRLVKDLQEQKRKEIEEQRAAAAAAAASAASMGGPSAMTGPLGSMAQQEMSRMMATYDLQVASLRARVAEYEQRYKNALEMLKSAPQIEAEAAKLNRDYSIHRKNYEDLVARREAAQMSGELDVASGVVDFRLIDPPRVTPEPVAPNRMMLLAMAFAISLGAGLFTAFAASQLRPVFHSAADLRAKVAVPLLGTVSMVTAALDIRRERMNLLRFVVGSGGLVGTFIAIFIAMTIIAARKVG